MRELIEELKQANQLYLSERDLFEEKLKTKIGQVHKFASQCQLNSQKAFMLEQLLADYKNNLLELDSNAQVKQALANTDSDSIQQQKTRL